MARRRVAAPQRGADPKLGQVRVSKSPEAQRGTCHPADSFDRPPTGKPQQVPVINIHHQGDHHLVIVQPAHGAAASRQRRRIRAEHSCFIKVRDVDTQLLGQIKRHAHVRWVKLEGDYYRVCWVTRDACRVYCSKFHKNGIQTYEGVINPVLRHMVDNPELTLATPRRLWVDLETDSRVPFSEKESARTLCWCAIDQDGNEFGHLLDADTDQSEAEMYRAWWALAENYDQILAWNGDRFDFPVIKARSMKHRLMDGDRWKQWLWLDHLELFKRYNMAAAESGDEKQSNKLGDVAQVLLGETKDEFDASNTWGPWAAGGAERQRLYDYCAQDTRLMPRIETETGFVEILQTLASTCGTFPDSRGINPSIQVEGYMQALAHQRGEKIPTVIKIDKGDPYKGAFVMEPTCTGITKGVHVADFSSLYPTIIRTWNMSPETWIGGFDDQPTEPGISWSPLTRQAFETALPGQKAGLLPTAVATMMDLRKKWNKAKAAEPPGTDAWKDADRRSSAYKIAANSFYGVIGQPTNRLFSRTVAESVTQCGAWLIKETIKAAEAQGMQVVYGDTDSLFVAGADKAQFQTFVEWCNTDLYPKILVDVGCTENLIDLAYEKEFSRLIMTTAKRYAGAYAHYKGAAATANSKPEIKGLEYKRGDSIRLTRRLQEIVVNMLVGYKFEAHDDPAPFEALLDQWRTRILSEDLALEEVVIAKKMGKGLNEYKRKVKKDGTFARQLPHVEMARILLDRGRDVSEGTKIEYVITDGTTKPMTAIPAEDWAGHTDRFAIWDGQVSAPTLRVLKAAFPGHDWSRWERTRAQAKRAKKLAESRP